MTRSIDQQNQEPGTAEPSKDAKPNNGQKGKSTNSTTLRILFSKLGSNG